MLSTSFEPCATGYCEDAPAEQERESWGGYPGGFKVITQFTVTGWPAIYIWCSGWWRRVSGMLDFLSECFNLGWKSSYMGRSSLTWNHYTFPASCVRHGGITDGGELPCRIQQLYFCIRPGISAILYCFMSISKIVAPTLLESVQLIDVTDITPYIIALIFLVIFCKIDWKRQDTYYVGTNAWFRLGINGHRRTWRYSPGVRAAICSHPTGLYHFIIHVFLWSRHRSSAIRLLFSISSEFV